LGTLMNRRGSGRVKLDPSFYPGTVGICVLDMDISVFK
jgi:hypothetical protein